MLGKVKNTKVKVMLINLPGESIRKPEEHCGLAYIKAFLQKYNMNVEILDAYAKKMNMDMCKTLIEQWMEEGDRKSDLFIGISPFVTSHESFVEIGTYIKNINHACYVYAGGHYASLNREHLLKQYDWLDAIVVGEGEITSLEMLEKRDQTEIPGLYTRIGANHFIPRDRVLDLDELPFQDRYLGLEDLEGQPLAITTSRGCYGECSFCSIDSFYKLNSCGVKQTYRSAKSVSEEIHQLKKIYGIEAIKIVDDNFFRNHSDDFLEELVECIKDIGISFRLSARPNDITDKRAKLLKQMGTTIVGIGVESADSKSLKLFNKGIEISKSDEAIKYLKDNGITCLANFIMFNPIIDINGIEANCNFVERHMEDSIFHRINSHLWIRSTDSIVNKLVELGLCHRKGFPYVECEYMSPIVVKIRALYDLWCENNMKKYYQYADILMAKGIFGNETLYAQYKRMLKDDVLVLKKLISMAKENSLEKDGNEFVKICIKNKRYTEN